MTTFPDPYKDLPEEQQTRMNVNTSLHEYVFLRNLSVRRGAIQITINLLLRKINYELRKRNIIDCSNEDAFKRFVLDFTALEPNPQTDGGNDGRGTPSGDSTSTSSPKLPTDVQSRGRGNKRKEVVQGT